MLNKLKKAIGKTLGMFFLLVILVGIGITVVLGEGGSSGENVSGTGTSPICPECTCQYDKAPTYGVRISLVYWENGKRVDNTGSIDVFSSKTLSSWMAQHYSSKTYTISGDNSSKYNRVEMLSLINENYSTNPTLDTTSWDAISKKTSDELKWGGSGISFNYGNNSTAINYSSFVLSLYTTMQKEVSEYSTSKQKEKLTVTATLFSALGTDFFKYDQEDLKKMHIMVEPIVTFVVNGTSNTNGWGLFYGTITQVAYAFQQEQCSDGGSPWALSGSLIKYFGVVLHAPQNCNTSGDKKYCYLNGWKPGDEIANSTVVRTRRLALTNSSEKWSVGVGFIWLGDLQVPADDCTTVVAYINELYAKGKINRTTYDSYILRVKNGNFTLEDTENDKEYKVEEPQDFFFLVKENYDAYNDGQAACANREETSQDCEAAVDYINSSNAYPKMSEKYQQAIAQVAAGTFTYTLPDGTSVKVDQPYPFDMLKYDVYKDYEKAQCKNIESLCDSYRGNNTIIDDCSSGINSFKDLSDEDAWLVCEIAYTKDSTVYSSDNTGHDAVEEKGDSGRGGVVGNTEYCEVFCYEEFVTTFPTHVTGVKAGQTFTWGTPDGNFGTVQIVKKCSTQNYVEGQQGYRFKEWEDDYKDNEEDMIEHYMKKGSYESMIPNVTSMSYFDRYTCDEVCVDWVDEDGESHESCWYTDCPEYCGYASAAGKSNSYSHSEYIGTVTGSVSSQSTTLCGYDDRASAQNAAQEDLESDLESLAAEEERLYSQGKNEEERLLDILSECTNTMDYVNDAMIQFVFSEPVNSVYGTNSRNFSFNGDLLVEETLNPDAPADTTGCEQKEIYTYKCFGSGSDVTCSDTMKKVWDCSANGVKWGLTGVYTYEYPKEYFQWYTLKTNSTLLNESEKGSEDEAFFYTVGFGLPTALSLTEGTYELKVIVYNIGDNATMDDANQLYERPEDTHFDPLGLNVDTKLGTKKGFEYVCTYEVENDIFGYDCQYNPDGSLTSNSPEYCDPTKDDDSDGSLVGVDITYRLVTLLSDGDSLYKAFPGKNGDGRDPGSNWRGMDEDIYHVLRAGVYDEPAMYEILLDVNAIQKIRSDNQEYFNAGKDPYASYYDANNNQKVYCATKGNEKYCASDFISDLYNGSGLNYRLLGTCLPTGNTLDRAKHVLDNDCDATYTYPTINWTR